MTRVVLVAPLVAAVADRGIPLGGAQAILVDIARGLALRGHDVTLIAARGSSIEGVRILPVETGPLRPARFDGSARVDDAEQRAAYARVGRVLDEVDADIIHAHAFDAAAFDALEDAAAPVLHTLHLPPVDGAVLAAARRTRAVLATVSEANARAWRDRGAAVELVMPNGVDVAAVPFGPVGDGTLLCAGRLTPEKGVADAIRVARAAGRRLLVAGADYDTAYVEAEVRPILGSDVELLGAVPRDELYELMSRASGLLMPVHWDEPFGLVAAEAGAAGAPVIGYRRGGLTDIVREGETGYLVEPEDEGALTAAVGRLDEIDRSACRANVEERFSLAAMIEAHERAYDALQLPGRKVSVRS
jgi:glycosyltransferase involved in cell wall biosynthesis